MIIPYEKEIKLSDEIPLENKKNNEEIPEGFRVFKFSLSKRRKNNKKR